MKRSKNHKKYINRKDKPHILRIKDEFGWGWEYRFGSYNAQYTHLYNLLGDINR